MSRLELYVEGQEVEGVSGDVVLTISVNNLRDISTRNGNYTNTFNVPRTNRNRQIFGSPEIVQSGSAPVYRRLASELVSEGVPMPGFVTFRSSGEFYRVNFFSGSSDFNTAIKALDIVDDLEAELSYLNHDYTVLQVRTHRNTKSGYVYPNIDYGFMSRYAGNFRYVPFKWFLPSVYVNDILQAAVKKLGYNLTGEPFNAVSYLNLALPCLELVQGNAVGGGPASYTYSFPLNSNPASQAYISFPNRQADNEPPMYTEVTIPSIGLVKAFHFPGLVDTDTAFKLELTGRIMEDTPGLFDSQIFLRLRLVDKGTGVVKGAVYEILFDSPDMFSDNTFILNEIVTDLANLNLVDTANDVLVWHLEHKRGDGTPRPINAILFDNVNFTLTQFISGENFSTIQIARSLPPMKLGELFKAVCNIEGIFTVVDENTKTVRGYYYNDISKNVAKAVDWSDLVDLSEQPEIEYRFNEYGQRNRFIYEQDEDDIYMKRNPNFDAGELLVSDTNLTDSVDIVTIPFGTVVNEPTFNGRLSMGKIYTGEKYTFNAGVFVLNPGAEIGKFSKRIVRLVDSNTQVYATLGFQVLGVTNGNPGKILLDTTEGLANTMQLAINNIDGNQTVDGSPLSGALVTIASITGNEITITEDIAGTVAATTGLAVLQVANTGAGTGREASSMNFTNILADRYGLIRDVLTRTKIVRQLFRLRAADVYNIDFSKPVFVTLFSENFYVNVITQFKLNSKQSTQVELVRI